MAGLRTGACLTHRNIAKDDALKIGLLYHPKSHYFEGWMNLRVIISRI